MFCKSQKSLDDKELSGDGEEDEILDQLQNYRGEFGFLF